ncbi:MFS transporter [Nocardia niwae]|uniref:MFS transporter n=1 Tax=Nocardia niwae TaxID=626084 RepID=UPI0007A48208|nr:MFS transporter [Nocardia niwae]
MRLRGVLAEPGFRALWVANAFGDIASNTTVVALSVTSVVVLHASPFQVGVIAALSRAAYLVVALPVGVWVDRWSRKRVLLVSDLVRLTAVMWIPLAYFLGVLAIWQLMLVGAVVSTANVFFDVAHTAILPDLVGRKRVSDASARLQSVDTVTSATIPAAAGKLIASTSAAVAFLVAGTVSLLSTLFVWRITKGRSGTTSANEPARFGTAVREGIRYVAGHRILRATVTAGVLLNFGAGMYNAVIAVYVLRECGLSAGQYGYALALGSTGGFVGSLGGQHIGRALGEIRTQVIGYFAMAAALAAPALAPHLPVPAWISYAAAVFLLSFLLVVISVNHFRNARSPDTASAARPCERFPTVRDPGHRSDRRARRRAGGEPPLGSGDAVDRRGLPGVDSDRFRVLAGDRNARAPRGTRSRRRDGDRPSGHGEDRCALDRRAR